jgi:transmembrane sensor
MGIRMTEPAAELMGNETEWHEALRMAAEWSVRLGEAPGDEQLAAEFDRWLARETLHREAWEHTGRVSRLIAQTRGVALLSEAKTPRRRFRGGAGAAAALAAAAMIALVAGPRIMRHALADYVTGPAQARSISLEDGSTVALAPDSALSVSYAGSRRHAVLLSGEAYFEIAHDPARPFTVQARDSRVTVLGTGFDVRLGSASADVAVRHGRVRVDRTGERGKTAALLGAGQWSRVLADGTEDRGETSPGTVGSWSATRLVAIDRPLSEVIEDARRYYSGAIVLADAGLGARSVTGSYDMSDPASAIETMVQPHGGKVRRLTRWLLIVSAS